MVRKPKQNKTIHSTVVKAKRFVLLFTLVMLIVVVTFTVLYFVTRHAYYLYLVTLIAFFYVLSFSVAEIILLRRLYDRFFRGLYRTTEYNLLQLSKQRTRLQRYPEAPIFEFKELNEIVEDISVHFKNNTLVSISDNYSNIPLHYLTEDRTIVDHHTFHKYFPDILSVSQSYRNGLILMSYDLPSGEQITDAEIRDTIQMLKSVFADYSGVLFSLNKATQGIYIYFPHIDSLSHIKEILQRVVRDSSIMRKDENGFSISVPARFTMVCYPYSLAEEMFSDIRYAQHMGKIINIYLPERLNVASRKDQMLQSSANLNNMTKLLSTLASLNYSPSRSDQAWSIIRNAIQSVDAYLNIDHAGIYRYDDVSESFVSFYHTGLAQSDKFKEGSSFEKKYIQVLQGLADEDHSYFASARTHLNAGLGPLFDAYGLESGFFFLVYDSRNEVKNVIYFVNEKSELILTSYLRESLLLFCDKIGDYSNILFFQERQQEIYSVADAVLRANNCSLYRINTATYEVIEFSGELAGFARELKPGAKCYKALYGIDEPCKDCPLLTSKKKASKLGAWETETSLSLNASSDARESILLIKAMKSADPKRDDPYHKDLLVNSYYSLVQSLKNAYMVDGKGYILLLKIDNIDDLIEAFGSEKTLQAIRAFNAKVKEAETVSNIFYFTPDCECILLREFGQIDVVNECEKICDINRQCFFGDEKTHFSITYLPISYPQGYPTYSDFLRHAEGYYSSRKYEMNKSFIHFDESGYSRPASKTEFMLSVIDEKFSNNDFTVLLQPLLLAKNRRVMGAEMLLRLSDDYRKIIFNTGELIKIAGENGKIGIISNALMTYIGDVFAQYGNSIFKTFGFSRMALNTDYSYLSDPSLPNKISELIRTHDLPKGFLAFEIRESDIYSHYEEMLTFMRNVRSYDVVLVCDNYTGKYLSMDRLKELGVNEFKIDQSLTRYIDTDKLKYTTVRSLLEEAKTFGFRVGLIGVENMEQFKMITEVTPDCYVQGYAFYAPLDKGGLVSAIRTNNAYLRNDK